MSDLFISADVSELVQSRREIRQWAKETKDAIDIVNSRMRVLGETTPIALNKFGGSTQVASRGMNRLGMVTQQAGYQVGDFIVQIQSGTNAFVAAGQQLTQLAGLAGVISPKFIGIGAALGIVIPLVTAVGAAISRTRSQTEDATEKFDGLGESLRRLEDIRLNMIGESLAEGADIALQKWQPLLELLEGLELKNLRESINQEFDLLVTELEGFETRLNLASQLGLDLPEFNILGLDNMDQAIEVARQLRSIQGDTREELQEQLVLVEERLRNQNLLSDGVREMLGRLAEELGILDAATQASEERADAEDRSLQATIRRAELAIEEAEEKAAEEAERLAEAKEKAAEKAELLAEKMRQVKEYAEQARRELTEAYRYMIGLNTRDVSQIPGEGAAAAVEQQRIEQLQAQWREYQNSLRQNKNTVRDSIIRPNDEVAESIQQINSLSESMANSFGDAFMSIVDGTKSAKDAFKDMARAIIAELYQIFVVKQITGFITGALQNAFTGGLAPATSPVPTPRPFASGGYPMANQPALVGENGPELIMPNRQSTVMNADLTAKALGGGETVNVTQVFNINGNGDEYIMGKIAQAAPKIADVAKTSILNERRRGGVYKSVFG